MSRFYRKVHSQLAPPAEWLGLPLLARALGDELLRYADESGRIHVGDEKPHVCLWRLGGAHTGERRAIRIQLTALMDAGFVVHDGTALVLNTPDAQLTFSKTQKPKQSRSKAGTKMELSQNRAGVEPESSWSEAGDLAKPAQPFNTAVPQIRGDKIREEERREILPPRPSSDPLPLVLLAYRDAFEKHVGEPWMSHASVRSEASTVALWCEKQAQLSKRDVGTVVKQVIAGYFATDKRKTRWPMRWLAEDPGRYLEQKTRATKDDIKAQKDKLRQQINEAVERLDFETRARLEAEWEALRAAAS